MIFYGFGYFNFFNLGLYIWLGFGGDVNFLLILVFFFELSEGGVFDRIYIL